ncbi:MAG: Wzz/FepE/Etk N-terminal domain-containing protein [Candidatus Eisenbacteria bacterium]
MTGNGAGGSQISAREILTVIFRRKIPIILCAVVVAAAALSAASRTTSVYQATAKVLLRRTGAHPLATTWTPFYGLEEEMNTEVELVNTTTVLERALEILSERKVYLHVAVGDSQIAKAPTVGDLRAGIAAYPVEMSNVMLIRYTGADPDFVGEAANAIASAYVEYRVHVRKSGDMKDFFEDQLALVQARLMDLTENELALRKQGGIYDLEWQYQTAIARSSELKETWAGVKSQRIAEEQKLRLIRDRLKKEPDLMVPFSDILKTGFGVQMMSEYWGLMRQRDEKATYLTESNPEVKMLDTRIAKMRERFREEVERRIKEKEFLVEDLKAEEKGFEASVQEIDDALRQTPNEVVQIQHLEKEIHFTYTHYDKVLDKMLDAVAAEADDIRTSTAKVISPAIAQSTRAGQMQGVYVAFSIMLGITLGIGFGFLLENLDHSVKSAADVEDNIGVPLLGSIPQSRKMAGLTNRVDRTFRRNS